MHLNSRFCPQMHLNSLFRLGENLNLNAIFAIYGFLGTTSPNFAVEVITSTRWGIEVTTSTKSIIEVITSTRYDTEVITSTNVVAEVTTSTDFATTEVITSTR